MIHGEKINVFPASLDCLRAREGTTICTAGCLSEKSIILAVCEMCEEPAWLGPGVCNSSASVIV